MAKIRVAVLRGGPSSEYDVSLKTGAGVIGILDDKYEVMDILIDKKGIWNLNGIPIKPENLAKRIDVAFNALHGEYGEDGTVQRLLEQLHIPFTGSGSLASAIGMNKFLTKKILLDHDIRTPNFKIIEKEKFDVTTAGEIYRTFTQPCVIKPVVGGSSVATTIAKTTEDIQNGLEAVFQITDKALVEEFIKGKEGTCGVLENFRGKDVYPMFPIEIIPPKSSDFFDYQAKYFAETTEKCPGDFSKRENEEMTKLAILVHKLIGARHYSRTDFMIHPKRGIFVLEINTLPGLTEASLLPKALKAIGSSYKELVEHLINLALNKK